MGSMQATQITVEYRSLGNALGLDVKRPRISWKLQGEGRGIRQQAYQIQVAPSEAGFDGSLSWDTGKILSEKSVHIAYEGAELLPRTAYAVRVKVWDRLGAEGDWSETGGWETGLMMPENWTASWISAHKPASEWSEESAHYMRTEFPVNGEIRRARIYATAQGVYELSLNGARVGDLYLTPGWTSYETRLQYQTYDVTHSLRNGNNALGMTLGNGWFKGNLGWENSRNHYGNQLAGLLQLHIDYADGRSEVITSDGSWKASIAGPIIMNELYHGETYDAQLAMDGWNKPDFEDSAWRNVQTLDIGKEALIAQENEGTQVMEELDPIAVFKTPRGETVLDFGQNMVGWVRFEVEGAKRGQVIRLLHAEVLDGKGNFYIGNLRRAKQTITYVCKGDTKEQFEPHFTFQGFRYVKVEGYPGELDLSRFKGRVLFTGMETTGRFECSNPLLNKLQDNIVWGQRGNFLDVPTDCPQRDERLGWTGDAQVFIRTANFNMGTASFFTKWLKDLKADQREDGAVPHVIPNVLGEGSAGSAAWGDASTVCPWTVYLSYGDTLILEEQFESMKAWVGYMRSQGENEFLWNTGFHFGDWLGLDAKENSYIGATPRDLIATAFYAYSTELVAKAAEVLGREGDRATYSELYSSVKKHFQDEFVTKTGRVAATTQTAQILALMFGLIEGDAAERAAKTLANSIEEERIHLTTGFVGTPYIAHVLTKYGYNELAYRLLQQTSYPSWLYSVEKGATTIWEHWDGIKEDGTFWSDDMNSFNHYAYGAIGDWMYRVMAGLDLDEESGAGYRKLRIAPQPGPGISHASASYESMYGKCASGWKLGEGRIEITATVAPNTTASITLPKARVDDLLLDGVSAAEGDGVLRIEQSSDTVVFEVESGTYSFSYPWS
ncbi:alpha-L-rhamnosidase [Paenibacillus sp. HB172176]|uniref:alpha-L-rhamnosidase n=1 Tax=Paenibacillus sp. HB172176 TaxID=2493690 RepID=UPI001438B644|nr:alpha-L-rhamnosidase [Paenibacillus sp. HB172176]